MEGVISDMRYYQAELRLNDKLFDVQGFTTLNPPDTISVAFTAPLRSGGWEIPRRFLHDSHIVFQLDGMDHRRCCYIYRADLGRILRDVRVEAAKAKDAEITKLQDELTAERHKLVTKITGLKATLNYQGTRLNNQYESIGVYQDEVEDLKKQLAEAQGYGAGMAGAWSSADKRAQATADESRQLRAKLTRKEERNKSLRFQISEIRASNLEERRRTDTRREELRQKINQLRSNLTDRERRLAAVRSASDRTVKPPLGTCRPFMRSSKIYGSVFRDSVVDDLSSGDF